MCQFAATYCVSSLLCEPSERFVKRQTQIFIGLICLRMKSKWNSSHLQFVELKGRKKKKSASGQPPRARDGATNWPLNLANPPCVHFCQIFIAESDGYTNELVCRATRTTRPSTRHPLIFFFFFLFHTHFINFKVPYVAA